MQRCCQSPILNSDTLLLFVSGADAVPGASPQFKALKYRGKRKRGKNPPPFLLLVFYYCFDSGKSVILFRFIIRAMLYKKNILEFRTGFAVCAMLVFINPTAADMNGNPVIC